MNNRFTLFFCAALGCLGAMASTIYAPSLPAIAENFDIGLGHVQWTMTIYMLSMGCSQILYGPLSEAYGRKPIIISGMIIMSIGTVFCLFAPSLPFLLLGRGIQGVGAGVAPLFRALFRDSFSGDILAKYMSYLSASVNFFIPASPLFGGYLQEYLGWRSCFVVILVYLMVLLYISVVKFKETNTYLDRKRASLSFILNSFLTILKDPVFIGFCFISFFIFGAFFSWEISGPILLIHIMGYSPSDFGWISFAIIFTAMFGGSLINGKLVTIFGSHRMLRVGLISTALSGILMLGGYLIEGINIFALTIPLFLLFGGAAFIFGNIVAIAFTPYAHIAGFAASLYSFLQLLGGGTVGAILSTLPKKSPLFLSISIIFCTWIALLIFEGFLYPQHKKQANDLP